MPSTLRLRKIKDLMATRLVIYMVRANQTNLPESELPDGVRLVSVDAIPQYEELLRESDVPQHASADARFQNGCKYWCLLDGDVPRAGVWTSGLVRDFHFGEIRRRFIFPAPSVIYFDATTATSARGQGYYTMLRSSLHSQFKGVDRIGFALSTNAASIRVMQKSGARKAWSVSVFSRKRLRLERGD